jgi:hypothetical protein
MSPEVWSLTVKHGDDLDQAEADALQVIRRTLLGLMGHGFITDLNTYGNSDLTQWSYQRGTEDPGGIMAGLLDTLQVIALPHWVIEVSG